LLSLFNGRGEYDDQPFDIEILELFVGLFVGLCGVTFNGISWTLIGLIKLIPCLIRAYIELWKWYFGCNCWELAAFFFVWVFGNILMPVAAILVMALYILFGFYLGAYSSVIAYQDGLKEAYIAMWAWTQ
jgi:uncharacterized membrane protein